MKKLTLAALIVFAVGGGTVAVSSAQHPAMADPPQANPGPSVSDGGSARRGGDAAYEDAEKRKPFLVSCGGQERPVSQSQLENPYHDGGGGPLGFNPRRQKSIYPTLSVSSGTLQHPRSLALLYCAGRHAR